MIEIRQPGTGSWLDPRSAKSLAARLSSRLQQRCKHENGVIITLTYRRQEYDNALRLYRAAQDEQHVPLFLRRLARRLDEDFTGRWLCKMEFQRGGWVHWHIVLTGVKRIKHDIIEEAWGKGHVWIDRMTKRGLTYLTKYVAKPGAVPAWIYAEPPRSVKIIRVSKGFWFEEVEASTTPEEDRYPFEHLEPDEHEPPRTLQTTRSVYQSIGTKIARTTRVVARDLRGRYLHVDGELGELLFKLYQRGCQFVGKNSGWLVVDASLEDLRAVTSQDDGDEGGDAGAAAAPGACRGRGRGRGVGLHLIKHSKPDAGIRSWIPWWLDEWFREDAEGVAA